ncbi:MAG: twin-arginine translocase subunit TatC [Chitinispirillaceae bacterium]|nr:twin-arginine translocase subunit TatC [Chitinispirillaceae bacterium]
MKRSDSGEMSFLDHLEELRWRLIKIAIAIGLFAIPCGIFWKQIFDVAMIYPLRFAEPKPHLIFTSPVEAVLVSVKIALGGGLIFAAPVLFYQVWRFVAPGMYAKEKRIVLPTVIIASLSFVAGLLFCYFTLPLVLKFLTGYAAYRLDPFFKINDYFGFLLKLSIAFGVVFELPVISFMLARLGLIDARFLIKHSRIAVVIIAVMAALLSPPDVFSMSLLAVPLLVLYGVSILIARLAGRKKT